MNYNLYFLFKDLVCFRLVGSSDQLTEKYANIEQLLGNIKFAFIKTILQSNWLDDFKKHNIMNGMKSIQYSIGPPQWIFDDEKLDEYYAQVILFSINFLYAIRNFFRF